MASCRYCPSPVTGERIICENPACYIRLREDKHAKEIADPNYRPAVIVSLKGLKARARWRWTVGQTVQAKPAARDPFVPELDGSVVIAPADSNEIPAIVPASVVKFVARKGDDMEAGDGIKLNPQTERYIDFVAADNAFQVELERVYGRSAGDMRYQPLKWSDQKLIEAHAKFTAAGDAWRRGM